MYGAESLIVDIGSKTVDVIHVQKYVPVERESTSIPEALIQCMEGIKSSVYQICNKKVSEDIIRQMIVDGDAMIPEDCKAVIRDGLMTFAKGIEAINKSTKSHGAMRNCIEYVTRVDKTRGELVAVIGPYEPDVITYDGVYQSFLEEKRIWCKDSGRMYAHNIISWHEDETITPEQALEFGKEFAQQWFDGFQSLVGVHIDRNHVHCHIVTNSVSFIDGHKLHNTKKDLQRMKDFTNRMCIERGLSVAQKGKDFHGNKLEQGTVSTWSKDKYHLMQNEAKDSFVADCGIACLDAMETSSSREEFIRNMAERGWSVTWKDSRKHITFQNTEGKKVRDSNLSKTFHLDISKEALANEFERQAAAREQAARYEREFADRWERENEELERYYIEVQDAASGAV